MEGAPQVCSCHIALLGFPPQRMPQTRLSGVTQQQLPPRRKKKKKSLKGATPTVQHSRTHRTHSIVTTQPARRDSPSAWERPRDTVGRACCACSGSPGRHGRSCRAGSGAGGVNPVQGEAEPAAPFPYRSRDSGAFQHMTRSPHRPRDQGRKELQPADNRPVTREASRRGAGPSS